MILENSEKLKDWLSVVLEPLCDADSSALARYVIALLKKDKSDKDLKRIMIEQLDVFLSEETTTFVDKLFNAIASEEYLILPPPVAAPAAAVDLDDHVLAIDAPVEIDAVLEAASPSPTKDNVIKNDGNQLQQQLQLQQHQQQQQISSSNNSREVLRTESLPAPYITATQPTANSGINSNIVSSSSSASNATDANTLLHTKPAFDHKTKDSHNASSRTHESNSNNNTNLPGSSNSGSSSQHQSTHHHHHNERSGSGFVRSASPPIRSGGGNVGAGAYADKENQPRDSRRRRASLRSRSRSRSRSNERIFRRSRSRDRRVNEREKNQRPYRNKSPPAADGRHHSGAGSGGRRNFDRRRIGGGGGGNLDERQRFGNNKGRRSHSPRSRSISPERSSRRNANANSPERGQALPLPPSSQPAMSLGQTGPEHMPVGTMGEHQRQRCRDFDEKGYCVRGETCPWDHGINPVVFEGINNSALMMSMREYNPDAPEIWARGGAPPPGAQPPGSVPPPGGSTINPFSGNVRPNTLMGALPGGAPMAGPNGPGLTPADYARGAAGPMMPFPFNPTAVTTPLQRQLIPIPVVDGSGCVGAPPGAGGAGGVAEMGKRRYELEDTVAIADVPSKRKASINSRLGPRVNPNMQQHNSSLELRKVPRGLNTIAHLNNHFAKFGKIVNIQVSYEGDPEAAIVTFSTHAEANVAYRSTEAVLNNRFIKVFWHNDVSGDAANLNSMGGVGGGGMGGGRKNASQYHLHNVPAMPAPNTDSAKISNASQTATAGAAATPLSEAGTGNNNNGTTVPSTQGDNAAGTVGAATAGGAVANTTTPASMRLKLNATNVGGRVMTQASIRKKQEEQQKAVQTLANGLRKRKQELLQSYVKQMKTALELVERCEQQDPQRANMLETIKVLQETIDKLRKDVHADQDQLQAQIQQQQPPVKKTKEQQKKELLDMELELFAQQQEGNDTTAIQKRLEELQRTLSAGGNGIGGAGGGAAKASHFPSVPGATAARKRATFPEGSTRVDRRPKAIVVTGFAPEEADFVLGHFKHFGEISKHDVDREIPQLILSYATRLNAEQAVLRGKMYKDKRLQISWAPVVAPPVPPSVPMGAPTTEKETVGTTSANAEDKVVNPKQLLQSVSESESMIGIDTLPEIKLEDDEEDDESEDRSWRR
ncbi:zinc finger protein swm [Scaptodrosophila lebanonensis]|uniref:Zinc finger protein swm n=1 Tax=Drosophila lebanonensis TaxID=7225 RepID=A0A6J2TPR8_DROLE|nr:zinc finger protein swm [Scaptodrosophila lebanonensis]XP_030376953.1 zinc finger protein swm [Scaptodrosophila lebanonensis]